MRYTSSSWFPLKNFTKSPCHRDWQLGVGMWDNVKDAITGEKLKKYETVMWNRMLGNLTVGLKSYQEMLCDEEYRIRLRELGIPTDIRVV